MPSFSAVREHRSRVVTRKDLRTAFVRRIGRTYHPRLIAGIVRRASASEDWLAMRSTSAGEGAENPENEGTPAM